MSTDSRSLLDVLRGWDGYQVALVRALTGLTAEQLGWRGRPDLRSVGETASHISMGRVVWFHRVLGEGGPEFASRISGLGPEPAAGSGSVELVRWLEATWELVEACLRRWTPADLDQTVVQPYQGRTYAVPRQWVVWRVMSHDLHHGGELALALGIQGIPVPELGDQGGHLIELPLAEP